MAEPRGSCKETLLGCISTLGLNAGVTSGTSWEGLGNVRVGNAESATETPEKAIPAGGLSIKCGGWVKEAKLLLDAWPKETFPG